MSFFGVTMRALHFTVDRRSVAPTALREAPYHRAIWSVSALPYCSETWDFCHVICPGACRRPLDWEGWQGPAGCRHCGYDLRRAPVAKVPKGY
ncbi:MAG TPA: hypothetical protein VN113_10405, partial [Caulobacter sp.]|nr:hypothetical protein [Caulobacter sp.]